MAHLNPTKLSLNPMKLVTNVCTGLLGFKNILDKAKAPEWFVLLAQIQLEGTVSPDEASESQF